VPPFRWEDSDHSLVRLKLMDLADEMRRQIEADERRIQFENRGNLNSSTVPCQVLKMHLSRTEEWARGKYEIYCEVWQIQGRVKSADFVRTVSARAVLDTFRSRTAVIANRFSKSARRTSLPFGVRDAMLEHFRMEMSRLEGRWRRRFRIEVRECEHAERSGRMPPVQISASPDI
jgi:hypothetical protein